MAANKSPQYVIDAVTPFTAGQSQVIGPVPGDFRIVEAVFHGNTATVPTVAAGTYVNGVFTSVTGLVNGLDGAGAVLGTTQTALQSGVEVTLVAAGPIASGQYLKILSGANTLARYTLTLVSTVSASAFPTETTPA